MPRTATKSVQANVSTSTKRSPQKKAVAAPPTKTAKTPQVRARKAVSVPQPVQTPQPKKRAPKTAPAPEVFSQDYLLNPVTDGNKKIAGMTYKALAELLGISVGTEQFLIAVELIKGGESRAAINERLKGMLPATTNNGTPKQVTNLVSGVHGRMLKVGFKPTGTYKLVLVKATTGK